MRTNPPNLRNGLDVIFEREREACPRCGRQDPQRFMPYYQQPEDLLRRKSIHG